MRSNKIIILDNDPGVLHLLESALLSKFSRDYSMDILTFKDGQEALKNLKDAKIVVTDMKMFPMDGFEFIEAARRLGYTGEIVVYSAFSDTDTEIDLLTVDQTIPITPVFHKSEYLNLLTYIVRHLTPRDPR